ncbi:MAG: C25 family cysteine peptidase, partial [Candidatus Aminicenantes bacterium]|nr:C25 family cysteine peptidase [Candidatus Aminicenantes bacterium]
MKKLKFLVVFLLVLCVTFAFAQKKDNDATLISHTQDQTILQFDITSYDFENVNISNGTASKLTAPFTSEIMKKGAPAVRRLSAAVIVPDDREMQVKVLNSKYVEIQNVDLAPSKGNLLRTVNPDNVPYEYGPEYQTNAFYPSDIVELTEPYISRDYRGQAVIANPFRYNPVTKVLRVYTELKVKVSPTGNRGKNILNRKNRKIPHEFKNVYARHYLNYKDVSGSPAAVQYTPLPDDMGTMLIVSYGSFMSEMADFVSWKQSIGYTVDMVDYATIGSSAALKTYVANYYNSSGLAYLLLVGDHAQVPTSSTTAGDSDNNYGYIVGSDHYLDIFVGRFSAETVAHVATQVDRTVYYENDVLSSATWFRHAIGMASAEGPGHNSEYDATHMNNLLSDLAGYGYTTHQNYQSGGSTANLSSLINNGAGTMWYCGHGSDTSWSCGWTFTVTNVNALTNEWELPAIYSVACVIGNFKSQTCFCEAWLRATYNNNPTGAVAHCGSTINQSWNPPMDAQDEFVDLLISTSGPKRTFGGVFVNGMFKMIDINGTGGADMADTWICFGDSSVQLRTPGTPDGPTPSTPNPPVANFTADTTTVSVGGSVHFTDTTTNNPASWSWTFEGGTPAGSSAQNPTVTYNTAGTYDVILSVSNSAGNDTETKTNYITVTAPQPPAANFTASTTNPAVGGSVAFTDTSTNGPTSWSWTFAGGTPGTSTAQNPTITYNTVGTYNVSLTAANAQGSDVETKVGYITVSTVPYCASQGATYTDEWIARVQVGSLDNSSGAAGYTDLTSINTNLTGGNNASVTLTPGFGGSSYTEYWKIWIDYNGDHDFVDTGEEEFSASGTSAVSGSFAVNTGVNITTRMRVSMKYNAAPTSCEAFSYGEVEDYTATISGGTPQPPVAAFTASATTVQVGGSVTFTDQSTNTPTSWSWAFQGGTPSTGTAQNPTVTYNTVGTYDVTLTASNASGSDQELKVDYITVTSAPTDDIAEGVDYAATFTKSGNANWAKVTDVYYYGGDSAKSGAIGNSQSTTIETSVTVASTQAVKFYWKVSSEANYDYLRFYIDGVQKNQISGTVDWTQVSNNIAAGTHTLKWTYSKDASTVGGSDCGWV